MTASGGTSYSWDNSLGTGSTKTVSPASTITYTVTATDANKCSANASQIITVFIPPVTTLTPSTKSICVSTDWE